MTAKKQAPAATPAPALTESDHADRLTTNQDQIVCTPEEFFTPRPSQLGEPINTEVIQNLAGRAKAICQLLFSDNNAGTDSLLSSQERADALLAVAGYLDQIDDVVRAGLGEALQD